MSRDCRDISCAVHASLALEAAAFELEQLRARPPERCLKSRVLHRFGRIDAPRALEEPAGRAGVRRRHCEVGQVLCRTARRLGHQSSQSPHGSRRFAHQLRPHEPRMERIRPDVPAVRAADRTEAIDERSTSDRKSVV